MSSFSSPTNVMLRLILESSSPKGLIALFKGDQMLASENVPFGVRESGDLVETLSRLLEESEQKTSDIQEIILGIGPGSFTGLRVGASVAKALAYVHQIPMVGISSLRIFDPEKEGPFAVLLDAKMHGFCLQKGTKQDGKVFYEPKVQKLPLDQFLCEIDKIPLWIAADTASLEKKLKDHICLNRLKTSTPSPLQMLLEASQMDANEAKMAHELLELKYFDLPN